MFDRLLAGRPRYSSARAVSAPCSGTNAGRRQGRAARAVVALGLAFALLLPAAAPAATELEARLEADPGDHEARFQLALRKVVEERYQTGKEMADDIRACLSNLAG